MVEDFWVQTTPVVQRGGTRIDHLEEWMPLDRRHLHVGCADWPIFDPDTNLHLGWLAKGYMVDGYDTERRGLKQIREHSPRGSLFASIGPWMTERDYDCLLVPEVIEHVRDVGAFLWELGHIRAERFAITTPNALNLRAYVHESVAYETIHPDHNCWFTPYTLKKVLHSYSQGWEVTELLIVDNGATLIARGTCR